MRIQQGIDLRGLVDLEVARGGLAQHLAGAGVERGVERERSMSIILTAMRLGPTQ
jgi:hypothetical protein